MRTEFRWIVPDETTTKTPILQSRLRRISDMGHIYSTEWNTIPVEVVPASEFNREDAKR